MGLTLTPRELRRRIQDAVVTDQRSTTAADWHVSAHAYPDFPPSKDSGDNLHRAYAVGLVDTVPLDGRQRRSVGMHAVTTVGVRFTATVRADAKVDSYDEFLSLEADLMIRVMRVDADPDLQIRCEGSVARELVTEETLFGELRFAARHTYPLE